jgi:hypothetical protein
MQRTCGSVAAARLGASPLFDMSVSDEWSEFARDKRVCLFGTADLVLSRNGGALVVDSFPDEVERSAKAIDLIAHDDLGVLAAEHTVVEAYASQLYDNLRMREVFGLFAQRFGHGLPAPGRYTLSVVTTGAAAFPRRGAATLLDVVEEWVRSRDLPVPEFPPHELNHISGGPPDLPIDVTLYRTPCSGEDDGLLRVVFGRPQDLEEERVERLVRAYADKCPKLESARHSGYATLLVLESWDYVMNSPWHLMRAAYRASAERTDLPDSIVCCPPDRMMTVRTLPMITLGDHVVAGDGERDDGGDRAVALVTPSRPR